MALNKQKVVFLGAGRGMCQIAEIIELLNISGISKYEIAGALDDNPELLGHKTGDVEVIGSLSLAMKMSDCKLVWGLGNPTRPTLRLEIAHRLRLPLERFITAVHPQAFVSKYARLDPGVTIQSGVQIGPGVHLGAHVGVGWAGCIDHDTYVGPGTLMAGGVLVAGHAHIGAGVYLGQGCNIINDARVGDMAVVAMGAVVVKNVGDGETVVGMPAKLLRSAPIPEEFHKWTAPLIAK